MFSIPTDKIREVIGTGGKIIREIVEKTGAKINVEDDGTVKVASADGESIKAAVNWIKSIASDPEIGHIYEGTVVKTMALPMQWLEVAQADEIFLFALADAMIESFSATCESVK